MRETKTKKKRRPAADKLEWIEKPALPSGSSVWETRDGMQRLICSEGCDGIALPREYRLWQFIRGGWVRVAEHWSRKRINEIAQQRRAAMEAAAAEDE